MMAVTRNRCVWPCATGLACLQSLLAAGCSGIRYTVGTRPVTEALETTLRLGKSTPAEVIVALGKPSGQGGVMLPVLDKRARKSWTYYFEKGHVTESEVVPHRSFTPKTFFGHPPPMWICGAPSCSSISTTASMTAICGSPACLSPKVYLLGVR